jgi:PKD repeat protein
MHNSPPRPSRSFIVGVIVVATLVIGLRVAAAEAATYCVQDPACPAAGTAEPSLEQAVEVTDEDPAADTIRIGPGHFRGSHVSADHPVSIVGAGRGQTELEAEAGEPYPYLYLTAGCSVSDLTVRIVEDGQQGVDLAGGADAARVRVVAPHTVLDDSGIYVESPGSEIDSVEVDLGPGRFGSAIEDGGGAKITDSTLTAGRGISAAASGTTARRVVIHAVEGLIAFGASLNAANVLVTPYPEPTGDTFYGATVDGGNGGENASLTLADATIVGPGLGSGGDAVVAESNAGANAGTVAVGLHGVVLDEVSTSIYRRGKSAAQTSNVTVDYSAYDGGRVNSTGGNGTISTGAGNLTGGVDPRFVDPAAGDYRPGFDSPLLDAGPPMLPLAGDDPDLAGHPRVRDSDGNGSAVRDIGAYEYQRLAPVPALTVTPPAGAPGETLGFDSAGSVDPDGDPVSYAWSFGDGAEATGATASHAYAAEGAFAPTLTATDATGLSATTTGSVQVAVPPSAADTADTAGTGAAATSRPPVLSHLRQSAHRWLPGGHGRVPGTPIGTTFRFRLSSAATVRLVFARRVGKRWVRVGALTRSAAAGADKVRFRGRLPTKRTLRPGRYRVAVAASDAAGTSAPRFLRFTVL